MLFAREAERNVPGAALAGMGIELPLDIQRELRDLESRGDRISHYELLGLKADADSGSVRRAYLERSKLFHPDAYYRKETGIYGPMLSRAFQRISTAYQVLADDETRAEYDREHYAAFSPQDRAAIERREGTLREEDRRRREARERLLRSKGFARLGAARKLYQDALEAIADGQRAQAAHLLRVARELDPARKEIGLKLAEVEREGAKARAVSALLSGKEREAEGKFDLAVANYTAAFQFDSAAVEAAMGAARCALRLGDHQAAVTWANRAIERAPADSRANLVAARAWMAVKQKARARSILQQLLAREPGNPEAKELLRSI